MNEPRKWWLAGLLGLLVPGLGQIYNGQLNKGIFIILLDYCLVSLRYFVAFYSFLVLSFLLLVAITLIYYIWVVADSLVVAKKYNSNFIPKKYNNIYVYIAALIILGSINYFYSDYLENNSIETFRISSRSMEPSLLEGDRIIVDSRSSARNPMRGDLTVFEYPQNREKTWIKRVVAIGGDMVEIRNFALYVNGSIIHEDYIKQSEGSDRISQLSSSANYGPAVVPDNMYFVLGDNRDNSQDGRHFGFVAHEKIKGTARSIYWSWDKSNNTVRWNRIGMTLR